MPFYIRLLRPPIVSHSSPQPTTHNPNEKKQPSIRAHTKPKKKDPNSQPQIPKTGPGTPEVTLTLTITTDLGDTFFCPPPPKTPLKSKARAGIQHLRAVVYHQSHSRDLTSPKTSHGKHGETTKGTDGMHVVASSTFTWIEGQRVLYTCIPIADQDPGGFRKGDELWVRVFAVDEPGQGRGRGEREGEGEVEVEVFDVLGLGEATPEVIGVWARVGGDWGIGESAEVGNEKGKGGESGSKNRDESDSNGNGERMVLRRLGLRVGSKKEGEGEDGKVEGHEKRGDEEDERDVKEETVELRIWEEMGESIARHVWDAALATLAYISVIFSPCLPPSTQLPAHHPGLRPQCNSSRRASYPSLTPLLSTLFVSPLSSQELMRILELGSGCGIVGLALSSLLQRPAHVLLTDLPEAMDILRRNITENEPNFRGKGNVEAKVLNWDWDLDGIGEARVGAEHAGENPFANTLKANETENGSAEGNVRNTTPQNKAVDPATLNTSDLRPDLVLVSDCTYNADSLPALVRTLVSLTKHKCKNEAQLGTEFSVGGVDVLVSLKRRHESEDVFFRLMDKVGFKVLGRKELPLGRCGGGKKMNGEWRDVEGEEADEEKGEIVEIYGFGRR